jgi:membrane fusion protein (multidrug efflux system)
MFTTRSIPGYFALCGLALMTACDTAVEAENVKVLPAPPTAGVGGYPSIDPVLGEPAMQPAQREPVIVARSQPRVVAATNKLAAGSATHQGDTSQHDALQLAGDLRPESSADLAFKVGGQLLTVKVERGQSVGKGQLLAALVESEARAQLAQSEAAAQQARLQLALARDSEARAVALVAANAVPGSQAFALHLQAETAQAALQQALATRVLASVALASHHLKAPFAGQIVRVPDGVGQIVAPGMPLFRIEGLERLLLRTTVSESEIDRIHVGDDVIVTANSGRKITGKVRLVLRSLEATSRRVPIEISIPNHDHALVAGSYVRATLAAR